MINWEKLFQKIIVYSFFGLFFLTPLILTPFNYELFEFNKMLTVYFFTALIIFGWLGKMIIYRQFIFRRSFWDIPLLLFLISQFLSFLFSIDRHASFWGYYSRFNGGLLSLISYSLLYWAFISNLEKQEVKKAIRIILISATIVSFYGILQHFGIDAHLWVQDVKSRVFSTLGQPNWLAAWLVALIPLTWAFILNFKFKILNLKFLYLLFAILYLCLLFTRSRSGILGFALTYIIFWSFAFLFFGKKVLKKFLIFTVYCLIFAIIFGRDWIPGLDKIKLFPPQRVTYNPSTEKQTQPLLISESGDIRKVVWKGAIEIWHHYPLFGTGPETFAYSYYWFRPREHNDLSEWDFLYNKAHNEYLNYAACTGTLGLLTYLFLIAVFIFWSLKKIFQKEKNKNLETKSFQLAFLAGFLSLLVTNFFGFSVVTTNLLFFLLPAFSFIFSSPTISSETKLTKLDRWQKMSIGVISLFLIFSWLKIINYWRADYYFAQASRFNKTGQYNLAFSFAQKAINLRPFEPVYHDELAWSASNLAVLAYKEEKKELEEKFSQLAIEESDKALKISPYHLNFWKTKAKIGYKLAEIDPQYYQLTLQALLKGTSLAPTDPKIKYNLGLVYFIIGQNEEAKKTFQETIELKPNYEDPRYALALIYEKEGEYQKAKEQLEYILQNINPLSSQAKEKLEKLK
ncbi:MAG: O-antigen ligase family protein [Microgenomates group bacterium]